MNNTARTLAALIQETQDEVVTLVLVCPPGQDLFEAKICILPDQTSPVFTADANMTHTLVGLGSTAALALEALEKVCSFTPHLDALSAWGL